MVFLVRKAGAAVETDAARLQLVTDVLIVVYIVEVLVVVPAVLVRIPPTVFAVPAGLLSVADFVFRVLGCVALRAFMLDGFVPIMDGFLCLFLTIIGVELRRAKQHCASGQSRSRERQFRVPGARPVSHCL
jgi:hypothetical protein